MTRHDLPRCPHCGGWPEDNDRSGLRAMPVECANVDCPAYGLRMSEAAWSRRPIEAGYEADLIHAREVADELRRNLSQMRSNFDAMADIADKQLAIIKRGGL